MLLAAVFTVSMAYGIERQKLNFNANWLLKIGDVQEAKSTSYDDSAWQHITLPRAWNEKEAFKVPCPQLSDTVVWYRKHFTWNGEGKAFIEFEGVKWGAEVFLNGHELGLSENGVMAFGFDLTPYLYKGQNVIAVRVDNSWNYRETATGQRYQWNNKNFNANYGGIPKNVWLHLTGDVYQTLPLYSNLGTTGTYIYGKDYDISGHAATICVESQVMNVSANDVTTALNVVINDKDGKEVARFHGADATIPAGKSIILSAEKRVSGLHFWSWGYGYLYEVITSLDGNHKPQTSNFKPQSDVVVTRTGFRKTEFKDGMVYLNDRVIMMHGYAQRTSNEWPGVGMSVPAWLSDYSNDLIVKSGGNLVRWMHVTPWKQDVESCDRVGLIQAMPAGDAERDVNGRQWEQRCLLMRDAIIYNRNNPSILFYEGGNESISREHMIELRNIRDKYDPYGGRAIGSREMLDIDEAEYGGEMLYVNKSETKPMWAMEYYRDEGLRKYWDEYSYPFHKEGEGPLYRGRPAPDYNHNMDAFACGQVKHWFDYYLERPGTGRRVNSGGAKIVFSDTQTHWRGEANYRTSGVTDPMRIPKDAFYAMQVMWDGWVTPEKDHTYIVGHWNYPEGTVKPVYVISNSDSVRLLVNGKDQGSPIRSYNFLYTFPNVKFEPGIIEAQSYSAGAGLVPVRNGIYKEVSHDKKETMGMPDHLKLTTITDPQGFKADGADLALVQVEVVDKQGRRCPLDNRMVRFKLSGKGEWLGGIANPVKLATDKENAGRDTNPLKGEPGRIDGKASVAFDNFAGHTSLPVECGVNRVMLRSDTIPGTITLKVEADGLQPETVTLTTQAVDKAHYIPSLTLPCRLDRGETPSTPSFRQLNDEMVIVSAEAGSNQQEAARSYDDNELSEWKSDGEKTNAWITYHFSKKGSVSEIAIKPAGWRLKCYPLAVYAGSKKVWQGITNTTLGYVHIHFDKSVSTDQLTIRMLGPTTNNNSLGDVKELAGGNASELDRIASKPGKTELRIVEVSFLCKE